MRLYEHLTGWLLLAAALAVVLPLVVLVLMIDWLFDEETLNGTTSIEKPY